MPSKLRIGVLVPPRPDVTATLVAAADRQARSLVPARRAIQAEGILSIGAITRAFNERKVPTPRGSRWHVSSVANLLARAQRLDALR